ncbi:chaperone protein dnaJ, partial [Trifolium pratense]
YHGSSLGVAAGSSTLQPFGALADSLPVSKLLPSIEDEQASSDAIEKFDMDEVLDDFVEEHDVTIIPLVKVAGFKAVFHHHFDQKEIKIIPRKEMLRFSHQVPSYLLTGEEAAIMLQKVAGFWTQLLLQVNFSR